MKKLLKPYFFLTIQKSRTRDLNVPSGIPQGSDLGPTLFLLFIEGVVNEIEDVLISLFANDIKIAKVIKSASNASSLQQAIIELESWCNKNTLYLNLGKCSGHTINRERRKT